MTILEKKYLDEIKSVVLERLKDEPVKVFLFGSRARGNNNQRSDVDIGIVGSVDKNVLSLLREKIEDLNVPYKIEIVDFSEVSLAFKEEALKEVIVWKDYK
jgi:uncharacterized protein